MTIICKNRLFFLFGAGGLLSLISLHNLSSEEYDEHGLQRLVDRVIYKEDGKYKGSIPKMQSTKESGFKIAGICKVASTTLNAIYKKDLNEVAEYYSDVFGDVYTMALDANLSAAVGADTLYKAGHSSNTSKWAGQRMSIIRSTMMLLHGDLGLIGPAGMPVFEKNPKNAGLTPEEFTRFMIDVKGKAKSSDSLTTNMAAALASAPSQLNGLIDKSSFLIKDKISGLLADPAGGNSAVPPEMLTSPDKFNPQNVGDLYLALGVMALHIQNPSALSRGGVKPPVNVLAALNLAREKFVSDNKAINTRIGSSKQGKAKWDSAPLGPAIL
jgi:hypothetical protein